MTEQKMRRIRFPSEFDTAIEKAAIEKKLDFSSFVRRACQFYLLEINRPFIGTTQLTRGGHRPRKPEEKS